MSNLSSSERNRVLVLNNKDILGRGLDHFIKSTHNNIHMYCQNVQIISISLFMYFQQ